MGIKAVKPCPALFICDIATQCAGHRESVAVEFWALAAHLIDFIVNGILTLRMSALEICHPVVLWFGWRVGGYHLFELFRATCGAACAASLMSIVLARSEFGASFWLGFPAAVLVAFGVLVAVIGMVKVAQGFRDYRSEAATLSQLDRRVSRAAALWFVALQLVAIGVLLATAALVALVLPGMAVQAAFVTVFLTAAVWAAQSLGRAGQSVGATFERLVGRVSQINLAQSIAFWRWPYVGWALTGRVAHARQAGATDPVTLSYLNALDSDW